jgi:hypothetical protein
VQPIGVRLLDLAECTIAYNREKEEASILLGGVPACAPQKVTRADGAESMVLVVRNLDCVYIADVNTTSGAVRRTARFEKDYSVKVELDEEIRNYRSAAVKIGEHEYPWDDLLKGTVVDYLPAVLELRLDGQQPDGTAATLDFKIAIEEASLDLTDGEKKKGAGQDD